MIINKENALDDSLLHLIIMPTEQCNFRCTYCYESFKLSNMPNSVSDAVINLINHSAKRIKKLHIEWFGGEPTLNLRTILKISNHAKLICEKYKIEFRSGMTTNGYLLNNKNISKLIDAGVSAYQITLDGEQKHHDTLRKKINGGGSFNVIWSNLVSARKSNDNFEILLRIHFTPDSLEQTNTILERIDDSFGMDNRFKVILHSIDRLGGINDHLIKKFPSQHDKKQTQNILEQRFEKIINKSVKTDLCYAAKMNSFVIRPNGEIMKCTVAIYNESNKVGYLRNDGTLKLDMDKLKVWMRPLFSNVISEMACPLSQIDKPHQKKDNIIHITSDI